MREMWNKFGKQVTINDEQLAKTEALGLLETKPSEDEIADNVQEVEDETAAQAEADEVAADALAASRLKKKKARETKKTEREAAKTNKGGKGKAK